MALVHRQEMHGETAAVILEHGNAHQLLFVAQHEPPRDRDVPLAFHLHEHTRIGCRGADEPFGMVAGSCARFQRMNTDGLWYETAVLHAGIEHGEMLPHFQCVA
jgi:hypothetical protein